MIPSAPRVPHTPLTPGPSAPAARRLPPLYALLLCGLLGWTGCQQGGSDPPEDHAHHHIPGHYPKTYAAAVRHLRSRLDELAPPRPGPAVTPARLEQFADLLQWLPSLALETDMTEQPWSKLAPSVRRAEELLQRHQPGLLAGSADERAQFRRAFDPELALWEDLLPVATDQIFRPLDPQSLPQSPQSLPQALPQSPNQSPDPAPVPAPHALTQP
ncbi:MAG: hypothetical protein ACK5UC_19060 [Planctomycetaceae bacterium]